MTLEMVEVLPVGTEYPRTDKRTVIRSAFYRHFDSEIEKVYDSADEASGEICLSESELKEYIRAELLKILPPILRICLLIIRTSSQLVLTLCKRFS